MHTNPHIVEGVALSEARAALVLVHGRGGDARGMLALAGHLAIDGIALIAPQADRNTWYPNRFIAPVASNQPYLDAALAAVDAGVRAAAGTLPIEHIALLGFSQGACLALEYAARNPRRYLGVFGLSGALIEQGDAPRDYAGSLDGTPVLLGCSDVDAHIPVDRVRRSSQVFRALGAAVDERIYAGMGHEINEDESGAIRAIFASASLDQR
jgi:phospholipase/carboxylesterase